MDDMPNQDSMDRPDALGGLNPADLLQQGAAEDTIFERSPSFTPPTLEEMARIFPQFEMLEMIGQGGMGAVYKVRQRALDRVAALKILPPAIGGQPGFSQSFAREAKSLAKLNHPGIVTLYEFGREENLYYFLMEYVDGMNLRQLLQKERISPREAMAIVPQICDALQYAHDHGIVHRDIKPENLLLDRRGKGEGGGLRYRKGGGCWSERIHCPSDVRHNIRLHHFRQNRRHAGLYGTRANRSSGRRGSSCRHLRTGCCFLSDAHGRIAP